MRTRTRTLARRISCNWHRLAQEDWSSMALFFNFCRIFSPSAQLRAGWVGYAVAAITCLMLSEVGILMSFSFVIYDL